MPVILLPADHEVWLDPPGPAMSHLDLLCHHTFGQRGAGEHLRHACDRIPARGAGDSKVADRALPWQSD